MGDPEILFERRGAAGVVTLNRPQSLNAVTHGMVRALAAQLEAWAADDAVTRVVVQGAGERAFSAGGDIRVLYEQGRSGQHDEQLRFWAEEYALNTVIKRYRKPYVALIDGIVMGGGVGLSVHGSHRVAGDRYSFAMPEVGIGFFPDVGATWFMPRMPGQTGAYYALTGERLRAGEAVATGLATHYVPSARWPALLESLTEGEAVDAGLARLAENAVAASLGANRDAVDRLFAADRVEDVLAGLDAEAASGGEHGAFAAKTATTIRAKSPTSLKIALAQLRRGKSLAFEDCMRTEFRIVSRVARGHDFYEGVRAAIIAKDGNAAWRPESLAAVSEAEVERHFAPLDGGELQLG